jgi:hypothetical protein
MAANHHSQFDLLRQRRFLPFFLTQSLGAFNDNVYRLAIIGLLGYLAVSPEDKTLYTKTFARLRAQGDWMAWTRTTWPRAVHRRS